MWLDMLTIASAIGLPSGGAAVIYWMLLIAVK